MPRPNLKAVDPEVAGRAAVPNPYTGPGPRQSAGEKAVDAIKRLIYMGISLFFLNKLNAYNATLQSTHIRHEWFKVGLAASVAIFFLKTYMETYQGRIRQQKVNYQNFPQCTHAGIVLILLASVAFHVAYWPHYRWNTPIMLGLAFWGFLLQFMLLVPTDVQNVAGFVGLTFFLQQYK